MCGCVYFQSFALHRKKLTISFRICRNISFKPLQEPLKVEDIVKLRDASSVRQGIERSQVRLIQEILQSELLLPSHKVSSYSAKESLKLSRLLDSSPTEFGSVDGYGCTPALVSMALSVCSSTCDFKGGSQYHGVAVRAGFLANPYVGSSLITLYVKSDDLKNAHKVFDEVSSKNIVSWTAMISGFAKELRVPECLRLYSMMRESLIEPNDYTFSTLLAAFTGSGALHHGRALHCQVISVGFSCRKHVANALISMYCKCGCLEDALTLFSEMTDKDVVSWNSMISGFALHGLATRAIDLFHQMKSQGCKPDSITFLAVLSSCRHAGLVTQGQKYFASMHEFGVTPGQDHYSCLVDLLGRAGLVSEARDTIQQMPVPSNSITWGSLLSSCRVHGNVWLGIEAAESRLLLSPSCAATHVLLLNLYASQRCWNQVARIRKLMKDRAFMTTPGFSWIEIKDQIFRFKAEEDSIPRHREILIVLQTMAKHMVALKLPLD